MPYSFYRGRRGECAHSHTHTHGYIPDNSQLDVALPLATALPCPPASSSAPRRYYRRAHNLLEQHPPSCTQLRVYVVLIYRTCNLQCNFQTFFSSLFIFSCFFCSLSAQLTVEEQLLLSTAYKRIVGPLRESWQKIIDQEHFERAKGDGSSRALLVTKQYREEIEVKLRAQCR